MAAPEAKILVSLRNPIVRYRSGFTRYRDASEALFRGIYTPQLLKLFSHYPPEQVLVLQYEKCVLAPIAEIQKTYRFLGIDDGYVPDIQRRVNASKEKIELGKDEKQKLARIYRRDAKRLYKLVPDLDLSLWPFFKI